MFSQISLPPTERRGEILMELILIAPVVLVIGWGISECRHALSLTQAMQGATAAGVNAGIHPQASPESVTETVREKLRLADSRFDAAHISVQLGDVPARGLATARTPGLPLHRNVMCQVTLPYDLACLHFATLVKGTHLQVRSISR